MSTSVDDSRRSMLPRWRDSQTTIQTGELAAVGPERLHETSSDEEFLEQKISDWQKNQSVAFAADLVGAALVFSREEVAKDAAEFILAQGHASPEPAKDLSRLILGLPRNTLSPVVSGPHPEWIAIHNIRQVLQSDPRNSIARTDLARLYASVGLKEHAVKAMQLAIYLDPLNRFILRSGSRLFVHIDQPDRAHDLLRKSARIVEDPWIASAEIAVSSIVGRTSKFLKIARQMLVKHGPSHVTELASAIATLEWKAGDRKQAKKLFSLALIAPTDNTVAQAVWLSRHTDGFEFNTQAATVPHIYEAKSWEHYAASRWKDALSECLRWLNDEPFSTRPAILGSFITASVLEDYATSRKIAKQGLVANPKDVPLLNNLTFALASMGEISEAEETFSRIDSDRIGETDKAVLLATEGMLQYRKGAITSGRELYAKAIEVAQRSGDMYRATLAEAFRAREEIRARTPDAIVFARKALGNFDKHKEAGLRAVLSSVAAASDAASGSK